MKPLCNIPAHKLTPETRRTGSVPLRRPRTVDLVGAVACGLVAEWTARALMLDVIPFFAWCRTPGLAVAVALLCCVTPARWALVPTLTVFLVLNLMVSRTDWGGRLVQQLAVMDVPRAVPAIAVLAGDIRPDGSPDRTTQARLDHAYSLLERGYAPMLVMTRLGVRTVSYMPAVRRQIAARGLNVQVQETGPIWGTRDEVREIAKLARREGWPQVLIVSDPAHLRRVRAMALHEGLSALLSCGVHADYDPAALRTSHQRRCAFRDWLYEVYRYAEFRVSSWERSLHTTP